MKDHLRDHDDLQNQMRKEARQEQQAEAEIMWYEAVDNMDKEGLEDQLRDIRSDRYDVEEKIRQLRREIRRKEEKKEELDKKVNHLMRTLRQVDPEVVISVKIYHPSENPQYGEPTTPQLGFTVEKCPPVVEPNGQVKNGLSQDLHDRVKDRIDTVESELGDLSEYKNNTEVAKFTLEDPNSDIKNRGSRIPF